MTAVDPEPLDDAVADEAEQAAPPLAAASEPEPDVDPGLRLFAKPSLVALAHGIEACLLGDEPDPGDLPVVIALFQNGAYFASERRRYRDIARNSLCTLVGFVDEDPDVPSPVYGIPLAADEPLAGEFALLIISKCICVSLIGNDASGAGVHEQAREFATRWSFDRPTAVAESRKMLEAFGDRVPDALRPQIEQRLVDAENAVPRRIEARLTASFEQMVDKYEKVAVRLHKLQQSSAKAVAVEHEPNDRDSVTGASNRKALARYLGERLLAPSDSSRMAVVWIDIDNREDINAEHGRTGVEAALRTVVEAVSDQLRDDDCIAHWAEDEFVIVMPGIEVGAAKRRAEQIVESVASTGLPRPYEGVTVSVSCGVAIGDIHPIAIDRLRETLIRARGASKGRTVVGDYLTSE